RPSVIRANGFVAESEAHRRACDSFRFAQALTDLRSCEKARGGALPLTRCNRAQRLPLRAARVFPIHHVNQRSFFSPGWCCVLVLLASVSLPSRPTLGRG